MNRCALGLLVGLVSLSVAACQTSPGDEGLSNETSGSAEAVAPTFVAEEGLTPRERLRKSIALLEQGEAEHARVELEAYRLAVPKSRVADHLLWQIDADPLAHFGDTNFDYTLRPGDSLSIVARDYLGDRLSFYILARYNGLEKPGQVKVGQTIKVPGVQPKAAVALPKSEPKPKTAPPTQEDEAEKALREPAAKKAAALPSVNPSSDSAVIAETAAASAERIQEQRLSDLYIDADRLSSAGRYADAINVLEEGLLEFSEDPKIKRIAALNYASYAEQLEASGQVREAQGALRRAVFLAPSNQTMAQKLRSLDRAMAAEQSYRSGVDALAAGRQVDAYTAFTRTLELGPQHQEAKRRLVALTPDITETFHRDALLAYQKQELDKAIAIWDRVLEIDPDYNPAVVGRSKAIELKERLRTLKSSD